MVKGLPQGSILGPLLFMIFTNDMPSAVKHCSVNLYADDTTIYCSADDPVRVSHMLEVDLESVHQWIERNHLQMNVAKTQLMVLNRKRRKCQAEQIHVVLRGVEIAKWEKVKYLGVLVDRDLKWKDHILKVRHKCLCALGIRRVSSCLPVSTRRTLYNALVLPHFDYCSVVWHSCGTTLSQKIERVQNYAMRVILGKPPLTPSESLRQELGWTTLQQRREIKMLLQVHRCLNGRAPKYLLDKFITNADFGCRVTHGEMKLHLSRPNTDFYRRSFEFQGGMLWNSLPSNTRTITSKNTFKNALTR